MVTGCGFMVTGCGFMVTGCGFMVTGCGFMVTFWSSVARKTREMLYLAAMVRMAGRLASSPLQLPFLLVV
jgi:hypothetical protein